MSFGQERLEQAGRRLPGGRRSRKKTGHRWFETQDGIAYHEDFTRPKLFWIDLAQRGRFAFDDEGLYALNSVYMLSGDSLKYLCAVLNSSLVSWYMQHSALTSGMGTTRWFAVSVETIPVPRIDDRKQRPFVRLVDDILRANVEDPLTDASAQEAEIDTLVHDLYGLTSEEIAVVRKRVGP